MNDKLTENAKLALDAAYKQTMKELVFLMRCLAIT